MRSPRYCLVILLVLAQLLSVCQSRLTVYRIQNETETVKVGTEIQYSVGNFGKIPYGKRLIGKLQTTLPENACTPPRFYGQQEPLFEENGSNFALIKRGECTFTMKSKLAGQAGASLAIIYDIFDEQSEYITMRDDGYGFQVKIPAIFISESNGENLVAALRRQENGAAIQLMVQFDTEKTEKVNLTVFINPEKSESYTLLEELLDNWDLFGDHSVNLRIVFRYYYLEEVGSFSPQSLACIDKYCLIVEDKKKQGDKQLLRQIATDQAAVSCITDSLQGSNKLKFLTTLDDYCGEYPSFEKQCVKSVLGRLGFQSKAITECLNFEPDTENIGDMFSELDLQVQAVRYSGIIGWPAVSINSFVYLGTLDGDDISEATCAYLKNPSQKCLDFMAKDIEEYQIIKEDYSSNHWSPASIVILVIFIVGVIFAVIFYFYRRSIHRDLKQTLSNQVSEQVNQYIAFYESNKKSSGNIDNE